MLSNLRAFAQIRKLKMLSNLRRDVNSQNAFESSQNLRRTRIHKMLSNLRESAQIHISAQIRKHFQLSNLREFTSLLQGNSTLNVCIMYASFFLEKKKRKKKKDPSVLPVEVMIY